MFLKNNRIVELAGVIYQHYGYVCDRENGEIVGALVRKIHGQSVFVMSREEFYNTKVIAIFNGMES